MVSDIQVVEKMVCDNSCVFLISVVGGVGNPNGTKSWGFHILAQDALFPKLCMIPVKFVSKIEPFCSHFKWNDSYVTEEDPTKLKQTYHTP